MITDERKPPAKLKRAAAMNIANRHGRAKDKMPLMPHRTRK